MSIDPRRVRIAGHEIAVADDQPTFWDKVARGGWEPGTLAALAPLLGEGVTFLDLGAWVGPLSLMAAARGARVVALEADPAARAQFERNLEANPELAPRITLIAAAIAPHSGRVRLGARRKPGDSMSSTLLAGGSVSWGVAAITPAMLAGRLGPASPLVVKIDIEGGEYALLPRLGPLLGVPDAVVLVSFHPAILRESGVGDVLPALRAALAPFAGWRALLIEEEGPREAGRAPEALLREPERETWLLRRA